MTDKKVIQQALAALGRVNAVDNDCDILSLSLSEAVIESIEALRTATAQPADVAQAGVTKSDLVYLYWSGYTSGHHDTVEGNYTDVTHHDSRSHHADIVDGLISDGTIAQPLPGAPA